MTFEEYLANISLLHAWDKGKTWNTGGFNEYFLQAFHSLVASIADATIVETGAGNSTIAFLFANPKKLITIATEQNLIDRITSYCAKNSISTLPLVPFLPDWAGQPYIVAESEKSTNPQQSRVNYLNRVFRFLRK